MGALTFDAGPHVYTLDGAPVRSVTGYLRKVGLINFDRVPPSILEAAQLRGTTVHQAIHFFNEHDLDVDEFTRTFPAYAGYLESWITLMKSGRIEPRFCEHRVACRAPRFAGTFDLLGLFDAQAAVIDFATGHPEDACKNLQTAGYVIAAQAWAKEPGEEALAAFLDQYEYVRRFSVQLRKSGGLPSVTPYTELKDFARFRLIVDSVNAVDAEKPKSIPWDWQQEFEAA